MRIVRAALAWLLPLALAAPPTSAQEGYDFDVSQFEKKPFELGGYAELQGEWFHLDQGAALYGLSFFDRPIDSQLERASGALELSGIYRRGIATLQATAHGAAARDDLGSSDTIRLYEGYLTLEPRTGLRVEAGKRTLRWGKGYAWNPVGFVERARDPNDPELSREGFVVLAAGFVRSYGGALQTVSFNAVAVPTRDHLNEDFGAGDHGNPAAKLSLLYRDTDIDLLFLGSGARGARYGFALARNLGTNLEVHGEWAHSLDTAKPLLDATGAIATRTRDATSYLLGLRHLSARETTTIVEYYHNGAGYTRAQAREYWAFTHAAYEELVTNGATTLLERARAAEAAYTRANPMRRYLYLRVSQKDPFDVLYFTPSLTVIANLDDGSRSLSPEILYTAVTNLELRLRLFFLQGGPLTDFGERRSDRRVELRARYSF